MTSEARRIAEKLTNGRWPDKFATTGEQVALARAYLAAEQEIARLRAALERIADPTEMAGMGVTEEMTGPAKRELDCRMGHARKALQQEREE